MNIIEIIFVITGFAISIFLTWRFSSGPEDDVRKALNKQPRH